LAGQQANVSDFRMSRGAREAPMEARFAILTLGVDNLERAFKFYHDGLGFDSKGIVGKEFEHGEVAFFELKNGMKLAIYTRKNLAWDAHVARDHCSSTEFSIGYNVKDTADVDAVMELAKRAGATIVKPAEKAFWGGYHGYFEDPDGHLWEILWSPQLLPEN
jgi:uncharacterized protein